MFPLCTAFATLVANLVLKFLSFVEESVVYRVSGIFVDINFITTASTTDNDA